MSEKGLVLSVERFESAKGLSSGWRMMGVLAGLGRMLILAIAPDVSPISFAKSPPYSLDIPEPPYVPWSS
jgi:hypothetical protein